MPKKKKKGQDSKPRESYEEANVPGFDARPPSEGTVEGPSNIQELREMLPPELANLDDDALQNLLDYFRSQSELDSDDESDLVDASESVLSAFEDDALSVAPPGFFEALDAIDELDELEDPQECTSRLLEIIEACPQCGDAWLMLAVYAPSNERAKEYLHQALKVSDWMLGAAQENPNMEDALFHSYILTGLDVCSELWKRGMRTDALEVHSDLLNVSNDDSGGQRLIYGFRLLEQGWFDELEEQLPWLEHSSQSEAGRCLLQTLYFYAKDRDLEAAEKWLKDSHSMNPQIADFLLGDRDWDSMDDDDQLGHPEDDEAQWIALISIAATRSVEGFLRWMRDTLNYSPEPTIAPPKVNQQQIKLLKQIEQGADDWILSSRTMDGETYYTAVYVNMTEQVVGIVTDESKPTSKRLWEIVTDCMMSPDFGQPMRPSRLFVDRPSLAANWKKRCDSLDIECLSDSDYSVPDELFEGLHETIMKVESQVLVSDETIEQARLLPRGEEIWHVGVFHPPIWITDTSTPRKSCVALVIDEESELIRIHDLTDEKPSKDFLAQTVLKAMLYPLSPELEPCLPAEIKVHPASNSDSLRELADALEIEVSISEGSLLLTDAMENLIQHCSDASLRDSLRESAEMNDRELTKIYQNIARFYRASLWRSIPGDQMLQISSQDEEIGTFYAVIMGQTSQHRGIVICEDRKPIEDIVTGRNTAPDSEVTVLNYCEAHEIAPIDLWLIEQMNLDVAGEDAYPLLQRSISEQRFRRPTRSELLDIDIAIRCMPAFAEQPVNEKAISQTVSTFQGPVIVSLMWTVPS